MGINSIVRTRGYRNFMSKLYGLGASVVIIGALFKINHYTGADVMLIVGLGTESIIFFFSAFEPPHVEPDWSLVYPELAGIYHDDGNGKSKQKPKSASDALDKLLDDANIKPDVFTRLGEGLKKLNDTTTQLSDVSNAAVANDKFVKSLNTASSSADTLADSYQKTSKTMNENLTVAQQHLQSVSAASKNMSELAGVYQQTSASLKEEISLNKEFTSSMQTAASTAQKFAEKYTETTDAFSKTAKMLDVSAAESSSYNEQLKKIAHNLSALNALYEMQLKGSNEQMEVSGKVKDSMGTFLKSLNDTVEQTTKYKNEVDNLVKNIASLNKVYGNMLSAMTLPK